MPDTRPSPRQVFGEGTSIIAHFVRRRPVSFALAVTGAALFAGAILASSAVVGWVTDTAIFPVLEGSTPARERILPIVLAVMGVAVWKAAAIVLRRTSAGWLQLRNQQQLRTELLAHQLGLRLDWFGRHSVGDLISVADNDAQRATGVLAPLPYSLGVSLLIVGTVILLTLVDPWIGLVTFVSMTAIVGIEVTAAMTLYHRWEGIQAQMGEVSSVAHESFDGALTVKSLGREAYETERLRVASDELRDRYVGLGVRWEVFRAVINALVPATSLAVLAVGAWRVNDGAMTAGDIVTALYLFTLLAFPVQLIAFVLFDLAASIPGWRRVNDVLASDEMVEYGGVEALPDGGPAPVDGQRVAFGYDEEEILRGVSLDIPRGATVAVVGPTASGKTTLTLLLARLWDPSTGTITLDGRDLRDFGKYQLPRELAYVAQTTFLFDASVRDNVTMGFAVDDAEVWEALELAGAGDFVRELPNGLETPIGERGATLSGGQRQRIALARALVRHPRVLVLDDATSAVDPSVEAGILRRLREAELPSTIIIVAYRPSSIRLADQVIYVEDGSVAAQGEHRELLSTHPGYAALVQAYEADAVARRGSEGTP